MMNKDLSAQMTAAQKVIDATKSVSTSLEVERDMLIKELKGSN